MSEADLRQLLIAVALLLLCAHAVGGLFARLRQPRVIGEILGGLLLGPTILGAAAPSLQTDLIPSDGAAADALAALYQLGLIWLMFAAGAELRRLPRGRERPVAASVALAGMALPFAIGAAVFVALRPTDLEGPAANTLALGLVFTAALALTSIPVISRIMMDLGLLATPFARIVLGAAVLEDVVLFGVIGVAVGLTQSAGEINGLASLLSLEPGSAAGAAYYATAVATTLALGVALAHWSARPRSLLARAFRTVRGQALFLVAIVAAVLMLGVPPLFGGLVAGLAIGADERTEATATMKAFGLGFFVPLYFALVGFRLDLGALEPAFFCAFFAFACAVKAASVYLGARASGLDRRFSVDLAAAMNARGGPGIVLATVAFDAGIVDEGFFASLVMLAVLSSQFAGWWLYRRRGDGKEDPDLRRQRQRQATPPRLRPVAPGRGEP